MKDLGAASRILWMDIIRDRKKGTLKLSQRKYLQKVLETFNMEESRAVVTRGKGKRGRGEEKETFLF